MELGALKAVLQDKAVLEVDRTDKMDQVFLAQVAPDRAEQISTMEETKVKRLVINRQVVVEEEGDGVATPVTTQVKMALAAVAVAVVETIILAPVLQHYIQEVIQRLGTQATLDFLEVVMRMVVAIQPLEGKDGYR